MTHNISSLPFVGSLIFLSMIALACHSIDSKPDDSGLSEVTMVQPGTSRHALGPFAFPDDGSIGENDSLDGLGEPAEPLSVCKLTETAQSLAIVSAVGTYDGVTFQSDCSDPYQTRYPVAGGVRADVEVWAVIAGEELPSSMQIVYASGCIATPGATHLVALRTKGHLIATHCVPINLDSQGIDAIPPDNDGYYSRLPRTFEAFVDSATPILGSFEASCGYVPASLEPYRQLDGLDICKVPEPAPSMPIESIDDNNGPSESDEP